MGKRKQEKNTSKPNEYVLARKLMKYVFATATALPIRMMGGPSDRWRLIHLSEFLCL